MSGNTIYFESATDATKEFVSKYKRGNQKVVYWQELEEKERESHLKEAKYFIVATYPVTQELINQSPQLKLVQRAGIGVDTIDLKAAKERGVYVSNTPGVNAVSVADMTIGLILSLYRKIPFMDQATKEGKWLMWDYRPEMYEMSGKVHAILGMGNVGKEVAKRSKAFNTQIHYYDAFRLSPELEDQYGVTYKEFPDILKEADMISIHVPLLPETRNWIGEKELAVMKPTAVLVNVARGQIVDEEAVAKALKSGKLLGAAFDTFAVEPPEKENLLKECPNAILTPHIAGGTRDVLESSIARSFENIARVEDGELPVCIMNQ